MAKIPTSSVACLWMLGGLAVGLGFGCLQPIVGRPYWIVTRQHDQYPPARYLLGCGQGTTRAQAEAAARSDLATQFRSQLLKAGIGRAIPPAPPSEPPSISPNGFSAAPSIPFHWTYSVEETDPNRFGTEVAVVWSSLDGQRHAVLAVLKREALDAALSKEILALVQQCRAGVAEGDRLLARDRKPYQALKQYLAAFLNRSQADEERSLIQAVSNSAAPEPGAPTTEEVLDKIDELLSGILVRVVDGDGQKVDANGRLPRPVSATLEFAKGEIWVPVAGVPVRFLSSEGSGTFDVSNRTNDIGASSVEVRDLKPADPEKNKVLVQIDGPRILEEAGFNRAGTGFAALAERIEKTRIHFNFVLPRQGALRVLVLIEESRSGQPVTKSVVATNLALELHRVGFDVVEPSSLAPAIGAGASVEQVVSAARGLAELVVLGQAEADLIRVVSEGFVFAQARGEATAVRTDSGQVLVTVEETLNAAGTDEWSAGSRALANLARKIVPILAEALGKAAGAETSPH